MPKPTKELKSTPFTEVIELERIVTPDEEKRVDHIFVRRKKICTRHPEVLLQKKLQDLMLPGQKNLKKN